ncbi:hypothetical protein [Microbacterium sp. SORGH_AS_0862]|uniref:hypothetical protein n=1 Tax=Microbacterium sp. SORGH_AS_0862 TaxID=3041789 RepID=UPI00278E3B98|nr:hypothetical protein [Microbacterium sp. SORGH_AS_0862]MDQ1203895.1 hypothetical protein [Microbacterium sp. SORGH_AS_0862]
MTDPTSSEPAGDAAPPGPARPDGAHVIARHGDPSVSRPGPPAGHAQTHVDWVRPTDVAARAGARVLEKTADVNQDVHELVRQASRGGAARIRRALSHREADLVPDVSTSPAQPVLGRQGVSR